MANADINSKEFVVIAELTEDCQFLKIHHYKPLSRLIKHLAGKKLEVGFKLFKYKRSDSQNRYLWGICYVTICAWWKETFGEKISKEILHAYSKQVVLAGAENISVAFSKEEFSNLISELIDLSKERTKEEVIKVVNSQLHNWTVNVRVEEVLGNRILVETKDVNTSSMNTQEFSDFKDLLQAHWAEKGCDIPDPRENNLLSDYTDE